MLPRTVRKYEDWCRAIRFRRQRAKRGWDESAYWATNTWLAKHLGEILLYTADRLHGYPAGGDEKLWEQGHRDAGKSLLDWYYAEQKGDATIEQLLHAQYAMDWVAKNFEHLWD